MKRCGEPPDAHSKLMRPGEGNDVIPAGVRILADFLIGAHAFRRGYRLLTLDDHLDQAAFSGLTVITV